MSKNYKIATEFSILDRASAVFSKMDNSSSKFSKTLAGQMKAAELRVNAFASATQKAVVGAFASITAATAAAVKSAIPLGMELQQNLGGAEAVFGTYSKNLEKIAEKSYKNMGLSASDYLATANKMGSLFQGAGFTQVRALELTTKAMQRAADVASVMGIDQKMAMESIAGAAKGNFTMMDNLGVAMNATTLQAYALEKGMNFKWQTATTMQKVELAMKMFMERTSQYAGNFAREADETLSGSFNQMKSNIQDVLANLALGRSLKKPLANMQESIITFTKNITPAVVNIINQLPQIISAVIKEIKPTIDEAIKNINGPFGGILKFGLQVINVLWGCKTAILAIAAATFTWKAMMTTIYIVQKGIHALNIALSVAKGIHLAHQAAIYGTTIALHSEGAAAVAASVGMKLYNIAVKVAATTTGILTGAVKILNLAFAANPVGFVITAIVLLIGVIITLTGKWQKVSEAVDGFFTRIRNMKGIGGVILNGLLAPFELVWNVVRGLFDTLNAFKSGGFIAGIKMLGLAILQGLASPLEYILKLLSFIPGMSDLNERIHNFFETSRANILAGVTGNAEESAPEEQEVIANTPPTRTAAEARSYTREESVTTNRLEVGLSDGLSVKSGAALAPAFTLQTGRR